MNTLTTSFLAPSTRDEGQGEAGTVCEEFKAPDGARVSGKGCGCKPESDFTCFIILGDRISWQGQRNISEAAWPGFESRLSHFPARWLWVTQPLHCSEPQFPHL